MSRKSCKFETQRETDVLLHYTLCYITNLDMAMEGNISLVFIRGVTAHLKFNLKEVCKTVTYGLHVAV